MSPAEIVTTLRGAAETLRAIDKYAFVSVSSQPEPLVREIAAVAGASLYVNFYPDSTPPTVIVAARIDSPGVFVSFAALSRPATAAEIAEHSKETP